MEQDIYCWVVTKIRNEPLSKFIKAVSMVKIHKEGQHEKRISPETFLQPFHIFFSFLPF